MKSGTREEKRNEKREVTDADKNKAHIRSHQRPASEREEAQGLRAGTRFGNTEVKGILAVWGRPSYYTSFKTQQKTAYRQTVTNGEERGVRPTSLKLSPVCRLAGESQDGVALAVQGRQQTQGQKGKRQRQSPEVSLSGRGGRTEGRYRASRN